MLYFTPAKKRNKEANKKRVSDTNPFNADTYPPPPPPPPPLLLPIPMGAQTPTCVVWERARIISKDLYFFQN